MKLVSWNVNGIRAAMDKGFREFVEQDQPDILCLQETKATADQVDTQWASDLGYHLYWNSAEKKGYSGTSVWAKQQPQKTKCGIGQQEHDGEGRVLTATYADFHLVNVYTPNAQRGLTRLEYRQQWDKAFLEYIKKLNRRKPVIFCGDVNCAHKEIDLANPKANRKNAGSPQKSGRGWITSARRDSSIRFDTLMIRRSNTPGGLIEWMPDHGISAGGWITFGSPND